MSGEFRDAESKQMRKWELTGRVADWMLEQAVTANGRELLTFKLKNRGGDWLVIIEAQGPTGVKDVAFCTGVDMGSAIRTAYSLEVQGRLRWKESKPYPARGK